MQERAVDSITISSETGSQSGYVRRDTTQAGYVADRWLFECGWCEYVGTAWGAEAAVRMLVGHLGVEGCEVAS